MSVMEVVDLIKAMEDKFGVSAATAVTAAPAVGTRMLSPISRAKREKEKKDRHIAQLQSVLHAVEKRKREKAYRESIRDFLSVESMGLNSRDVAVRRFVPTVVYLGGGESSEEVMEALNEFTKTLGFETIDDEPPVISSFLKRMWARTFSRKTGDELSDAFEKGKEAIEAQHIEKPKSEAQLNRANAAAALLNAMGKDSKSTAILHGELLVLCLVDANGDRHNRAITLTKEQNEIMMSDPTLILDPDNLLSALVTSKKISKTVEKSTPIQGSLSIAASDSSKR